MVGAGCGTGKHADATAIDHDAETYVRIVLALAERDPDSLDSYFGPPAWREEAHAQYKPLREIHQNAQQLAAALKRSHDSGPRVEFLERQLRAVIARIDVLTGVRRSFADESRLLFGIDPPPSPDRAQADAARHDLERLLPGRGDVAHRMAAFQRRFVVPPDRLAAVFSRAVVECRAATRRYVTLPSDERVDVEYVSDLPWTAFTRYLGDHKSRVTVNAAVAFTVDEVLQVACHEAYPGHHVINLLVDDALVRGERRVELSVQPLFSPQALLAEGAASIASPLAFTGDERLAVERSTLFGVAGISPEGAETAIEVGRLLASLDSVRADISARYADGNLEFARAAAALEHEALMPSAEPMLKFLNQFRSYAVTYARGPELASAWLDARAAPDDRAARWRAYVQLVTNPAQAFERK